MHNYIFKRIKTWTVGVILLSAAATMADEQNTADGLIEFKSEAGKFSIRLPAKPEEGVVEVGDAKEKQHQFTTGAEKGAFIVSYQDNPNLKGSTPKEIAAALESARDRLKEVFHGKLVESKTTTLNKSHPGLNFRLEMTQPKGEARCRFYMIGTRLYQIIVIGEPEFANSGEATQIIDSFKLLK